VGWADRAVLDAMPKSGRRGGLDGVAHRLDRRVADRMRGDLQTMRGRPHDDLAQLFGCGPPHAPTRPHGDALGAAVDEDFDRARANHRTAEAGAHAEL